MTERFTYSDFQRLLQYNGANFNRLFLELLEEMNVKTLRIDKINTASIELCKVRVRTIGDLAWVAMTESEFTEFFDAMKIHMSLQRVNTYVGAQVEMFTFNGYTGEHHPETMLLYKNEKQIVRYKDYVESLVAEEKGYRTGDVMYSDDDSYVVLNVTGSESPYTEEILVKRLQEIELDDMGSCTSKDNYVDQVIIDLDNDVFKFSGIKLRRW